MAKLAVFLIAFIFVIIKKVDSLDKADLDRLKLLFPKLENLDFQNVGFEHLGPQKRVPLNKNNYNLNPQYRGEQNRVKKPMSNLKLTSYDDQASYDRNDDDVNVYIVIDSDAIQKSENKEKIKTLLSSVLAALPNKGGRYKTHRQVQDGRAQDRYRHDYRNNPPRDQHRYQNDNNQYNVDMQYYDTDAVDRNAPVKDYRFGIRKMSLVPDENGDGAREIKKRGPKGFGFGIRDEPQHFAYDDARLRTSIPLRDRFRSDIFEK